MTNGSFSTLFFATVSLRIHVEFLNNERGKRERQVMLPCVVLIKVVLLLIIFQVIFSFNPFRRQLATFARILVGKYFFHSPWRPKWSQLGVLFCHINPPLKTTCTLVSTVSRGRNLHNTCYGSVCLIMDP